MSDNTQGALKVAAEDAIRQFIAILDGEDTTDFYELVLAEVEEPLLRVVMEYTGNNQSRAAAILSPFQQRLTRLLHHFLVRHVLFHDIHNCLNGDGLFQGIKSTLNGSC